MAGEEPQGCRVLRMRLRVQVLETDSMAGKAFKILFRFYCFLNCEVESLDNLGIFSNENHRFEKQYVSRMLQFQRISETVVL